MSKHAETKTLDQDIACVNMMGLECPHKMPPFLKSIFRYGSGIKYLNLTGKHIKLIVFTYLFACIQIDRGVHGLSRLYRISFQLHLHLVI